MAKERDWIDYANLGSNLYRNVQLGNAQNDLNAMASAAVIAQEEAIKTRRIADRAQTKSEREDNDRESVFQAETNLKDLRAHLKDEKTSVLTLASFALANFERHKLTTSSFRAFEDKERLQAVLTGYKAIVAECLATLPPSEIKEARKCVSYMLEPDNDCFVSAALKEELAQVNKDLKKIARKYKNLTRAGSVGIALLVFTCLVEAYAANARQEYGDQGDKTIPHTAQVVADVALVFITVACGIICWRIISPKQRKLRRAIKERKLEIEAQNLKEAEAQRDILRKEVEAQREILRNRRLELRSAIDSDRERVRAERQALYLKLLKRDNW